MPVTHDMILHFDQMKSFYRGLAAGEAFPRWEEDTNRGFGAPTTSYYPPGVYYLTSGIYAIVRNWIWTLLLALFLMMVASGLAIYAYARRFMRVGPALLTMTAYVFLPYHLFDQYQRGAIAELFGFTFMPLMLMFAESLFTDNNKSEHSSLQISEGEGDYNVLHRTKEPSRPWLNTLALAMTLGAFLWCHPPTAYQFMLTFTLFAALWAWMLKDWKGLLRVGIAIALGLALSAAYLYPAFVEQHLIHREFISNTWPYYSTYIFSGDSGYDLVEFMWMFNVAAVVAGAGILLFVESDSLKPWTGLRKRVWLWLAVGCFASFMMTKASHPLGLLIPRIDIGVFSWRMLGITTLVTAMIAGACAQAGKNPATQQRPSRNSLASLASVAIVAGAILVAARIILSMYGAPGFATAEEHVNLAMMPATAPVEPLELPRVERAELASGEGTLEVESWEPEHRVLKVELNAPDRLLIRTFDFPGWVATVDGEQAPINSGTALRVELPNSEQALIRAATFRGGTPFVDGKPGRIIGSEPLGDIEVELSPGVHRVALDYVDTPPRRLGAFITGGAFLLVVGLTLGSSLMGMRSK